MKRKERLQAINEDKNKEDFRQRAQLKKKALIWRENGTKALDGLRTGILGVRFLLEPHHNMNKTVAYFERCVENMEFDTAQIRLTRNSFPLACRVLYACHDPEPRQFWLYSKSNLIMLKFSLMQEIRTSYILKHPTKCEYHSRPSEIRVLRHLFRIYMNNIPIDREISEKLKAKRAHFRTVCAKLKLIHDTQHACAQILVCKSRQHTNPKGCTACGVQYIGGMLDGGTPYIHSVSRDTKLTTLVTLDFEVETLRQEEIVQLEIVQTVGMDLQAYEESVCSIVRVNIQVWWCIVLVWKRYKSKSHRIYKSKLLHKRRRLVTLKHDVDMHIKEAAPLDMKYFEEAYCDILSEMYEYTNLQIKLKQERILKWSKCFQKKLVVIVDEAHQRDYQEYLRRLSLPKPPRAIIFKTLPITTSTTDTLICYRLECKMRKFLTQERYNIHMNVHYKQDQIRYQHQNENKNAKNIRDQREKVVMNRIKDSRLRILYTNSDYNSQSNSSNNTAGITRDEDEEVRSVGSQASVNSGSLGVPELSQVSLPSTLQHQQYDQQQQQQYQPDYRLSGYSNSNVGGHEENQEEDGSDTPVPTTIAVVNRAGYAQRKQLSSTTPDTSIADSTEHPLPHRSEHNSTVPHTTTPYISSNSHPIEGLSQALSQMTHSALQKASTHSPSIAATNSTLRDSQDLEMNFESAQSVHDWASMTHIYTLHSLVNDCLYSLELVSKHGDVEVAMRVPLDRPVVRIGTQSSCECVVATMGAAKRDGKVATVHCMLYCPTHRDQHRTKRNTTTTTTDDLTIVDNNTIWGTYIVSSTGTHKAPVKVTAGRPLTSGLLICIGVVRDGPGEISAIQANQACVVYRVRCMEQEILS